MQLRSKTYLIKMVKITLQENSGERGGKFVDLKY